MNVRMSGHGAGGATQMLDGLVDLALFFEDAAEVVARNSIQGIELDGGKKLGAGLFGAAHLIESDAQVDVRVNPVGREVDHQAVIVDGLGQRFGLSLAIERRLKQILGGWSRHRVQFCPERRRVEGESPLLLDRAEWP